MRPDVSCAAGKIICMSSVHEVIPWAGHVNYAASKGGVMLMMKSIAQEVAPYRIRVNSICPGAIRTPINTDAWDTPEAYSELMKLIPYKRIGEPDDIGRAAVWLASDYADYITRHQPVRRRRHDALSRLRDRRLTWVRIPPLPRALVDHWPEYLIEALCAGPVHGLGRRVHDAARVPGFRASGLIANADLRRALIGVAMGLTCVALVYSPWGHRSGAHMNPAVTLAFWRLRKVRGSMPPAISWRSSSVALLGVLLVHRLLGSPSARRRFPGWRRCQARMARWSHSWPSSASPSR